MRLVKNLTLRHLLQPQAFTPRPLFLLLCPCVSRVHEKIRKRLYRRHFVRPEAASVPGMLPCPFSNATIQLSIQFFFPVLHVQRVSSGEGVEELLVLLAEATYFHLVYSCA